MEAVAKGSFEIAFPSHVLARAHMQPHFSPTKVPTGAMVYALRTQLEASNTSFLAEEDSPSMLAVQMTAGSSMRALGCSFHGWDGAHVVLTGGELEMDLCDFRERCGSGEGGLAFRQGAPVWPNTWLSRRLGSLCLWVF